MANEKPKEMTIPHADTAARHDLEASLERRVHLFLRVKVAPKWTDDPARYREMGLEFPR